MGAFSLGKQCYLDMVHLPCSVKVNSVAGSRLLPTSPVTASGLAFQLGVLFL